MPVNTTVLPATSLSAETVDDVGLRAAPAAAARRAPSSLRSLPKKSRSAPMTVSPMPLIDGKTVCGSSAAAVSLPTRMNSSMVEKVLASTRRRRVADVADAEREDEAVEFRLAARVDGREQLVEALVGALLAPTAPSCASCPSRPRARRACASRRSNSACCTSARRSFSVKMSAAVLSSPALKNRSMFSAPSPSMSMRAARHEVAQRLHRLRRRRSARRCSAGANPPCRSSR